MTKFLNISTDNTLGGVSPGDETVVSQKAIKNYVDNVIPTVNDATITITQGGVTKGSFTLNQATGDTIALDAGGGGGSVAIDNTTITENASQEIQAVATVNANTANGATNPIYDWVGTLAEYTAQNIATTHPDWLCYITDDNTAQAFDAYSKTESDARYVQQGHQVIEFQAPTAGNNHTWYRKYADGWVEMGGQTSDTTDGAIAITLPVELADANYIPLITGTYIANTGTATNNGASKAAGAFSDRTTTGFNLWKQSPVPYGWQVSGMVA